MKTVKNSYTLTRAGIQMKAKVLKQTGILALWKEKNLVFSQKTKSVPNLADLKNKNYKFPYTSFDWESNITTHNFWLLTWIKPLFFFDMLSNKT